MMTSGKEYTTEQLSEIMLFCEHLIKDERFWDLERFMELMLVLDMPLIVKISLLRYTLPHNKAIKDAWNKVLVSAIADCRRDGLDAYSVLKGLKNVTDG